VLHPSPPSQKHESEGHNLRTDIRICYAALFLRPFENQLVNQIHLRRIPKIGVDTLFDELVKISIARYDRRKVQHLRRKYVFAT
jgi:hypothetical protein